MMADSRSLLAKPDFPVYILMQQGFSQEGIMPRIFARLFMVVSLLCLPAGVMAGVDRPAQVRININTADEAALDEALLGVGPGRARAIVAWRRQHGAFRSLEELQQVKGLGPAFLARNRDRIRLQ